MKIISVIFNSNYGRMISSLCEYDTETKQKTYINIPPYIARLIASPYDNREIKPDVVVAPLKTKELPLKFDAPNFSKEESDND